MYRINSLHEADASSYSVKAPHPQQLEAELNFYNVFGNLLTDDQPERTAVMDEILDRIKGALTESQHEATAPQAQQFLAAHMPSLVRLSLECPYEDVRRAFKAFLTTLTDDNTSSLSPTTTPARRTPAAAAVDTPRDYDRGRWSKLKPPVEGPSYYYPLSMCPTIVSSLDEERNPSYLSSASPPCTVTLGHLFEEQFLVTGRLTHIEWLLGWHPSYLSQYIQTMQFIMYEDGPLPRPWRHYIAILAATRHRCDYLIQHQEWEFLHQEGDAAWLTSITAAPPKLALLHEFNALLAHQPWLITRKNIEKLTREGGWSISELVHAVMILSTFHALCGLVYGVGVTPEVDMVDLTTHQRRSVTAPTPPPMTPSSLAPRVTSNGGGIVGGGLVGGGSGVGVVSGGRGVNGVGGKRGSVGVSPPKVTYGDLLIERLQQHSLHADEEDDDEDEGDDIDLFQTVDPVRQSSSPVSPNALTTHTHAGTTSLTSTTTNTTQPSTTTSPSSTFLQYGPVRITRDWSRYYDHIATDIRLMHHQDFDVHSANYSTFYMSDFDWKANGVPLVNEYYLGFAPLIDAQWDHIRELTYSTISHNNDKKVDTTPFRRAIWYYVHRLYGICAHDYRYEQVNKYLSFTNNKSSSLKLLIKAVACNPEKVCATDVELSDYPFHPDELEHIILLVIEARRQAEVLYALHAVMTHMK